MTIYTHLQKPKVMPTPSGSKYLETYQEQITDGIRTLVLTGYTNIYEKIQEGFEASKIQNILQAVAMGDLSALNAREGTYCDATTMPKNLMEANNLMLRMRSEFEKMPIEVKEIFNNSSDKYIELMGTEEFNKKMAPYNEQVARIAEEKSHKEYLKKVSEGAKLNYDIKNAEKALGGTE